MQSPARKLKKYHDLRASGRGEKITPQQEWEGDQLKYYMKLWNVIVSGEDLWQNTRILGLVAAQNATKRNLAFHEAWRPIDSLLPCSAWLYWVAPASTLYHHQKMRSDRRTSRHRASVRVVVCQGESTTEKQPGEEHLTQKCRSLLLSGSANCRRQIRNPNRCGSRGRFHPSKLQQKPHKSRKFPAALVPKDSESYRRPSAQRWAKAWEGRDPRRCVQAGQWGCRRRCSRESAGQERRRRTPQRESPGPRQRRHLGRHHGSSTRSATCGTPLPPPPSGDPAANPTLQSKIVTRGEEKTKKNSVFGGDWVCQTIQRSPQTWDQLESCPSHHHHRRIDLDNVPKNIRSGAKTPEYPTVKKSFAWYFFQRYTRKYNKIKIKIKTLIEYGTYRIMKRRLRSHLRGFIFLPPPLSREPSPSCRRLWASVRS